MRIFGLLIFCLTITVLYYTASARQSRPRDLRTAGDFYGKTVQALPKHDADDEEVKARTQRLKDAAREARDKANGKALKPDAPGDVEGVGSASEGRGRKKKVEEGEGESEEDHVVEVELNAILKKAPSLSSLISGSEIC